MSSLKYTVVKKSLERRDIPLARTRLVFQDGVAFTEPEKDILATAAQTTCIHVLLRSPRINALTHLDSKINHFNALAQIVFYLAGQKRNGPISEAHILTNLLSSRTAICRAFYSLRLLGLCPTVVRCLPLFSNDIFVDQTGVYRTSISNAIGYDRVSDEIFSTIASSPAEVVKRARANMLICENTGKPIEDSKPFDIYPGVPLLDVRDARHSGRKKRYVINIKVDEFDPELLHRIAKLEGVTISIESCAAGKYVSVASRREEHVCSWHIVNAQTTAMHIAELLL